MDHNVFKYTGENIVKSVLDLPLKRSVYSYI